MVVGIDIAALVLISKEVFFWLFCVVKQNLDSSSQPKVFCIRPLKSYSVHKKSMSHIAGILCIITAFLVSRMHPGFRTENVV
jgi:hypothetical protein